MNTEIAWAAGFFDGEGTTYVMSDKYKYLKVQIGQRERATLERFRAAVGSGRIHGPYTQYSLKGVKCEYYMYADINKRALDILNVMWPYLSEPKKLQALKAFDRSNFELKE